MSRKSKNTAICRRAKTLHRTIIAVARAMSKTIAASKPPTAYPATGEINNAGRTAAHLKFFKKSSQAIVPEAISHFQSLSGYTPRDFMSAIASFTESRSSR